MDPFTLCEAYGFLICKECKHAVLVREADTHLRAKHRNITVPQRKSIVQKLTHLTLFQDQKALQSFRLPAAPVPAIPLLAGPYGDGRKCRSCPYVARQERRIQEHCRTVHGWVNPRTKGGNMAKKSAKEVDIPWKAGIRCQRFLPSRLGSGWFEVLPDDDEPSTSDVDPVAPFSSVRTRRKGRRRRLRSPEPQAATDDTFLQSVLTTFHEAQGRTAVTIQNHEGKTEPNPWLRRVGWAEHFAGYDAQLIYRTASLDIEDGWGEGDCAAEKAMLQRAYDSLERVVLSAQSSCSDDQVGLAVLFEIGRKAFNTKPSTPFTGRLEKDTVRRYVNVWKRILGYLFRTMEMDDDHRPPYDFTRQQEKRFARLRQLLYQDKRRTTAATVVDDDDDDDNDNSLGLLDRTLLDFLVSLLDHELLGPAYESGLLSALAAMGVREDGGWLGPENYTGFYSAVVKVARMLVARQSEIEAGDEGPIFPIVRQKVRRFMTLVHPDSNPTPMDWIFDARTYGLKIRYTTAVAGQISWAGQTVTYRTHSFTTSALAEMMHQLVAELRRTMDRLTFTDQGVELPLIKVSELSDDIGNERVGFSFLQVPENQVLLTGLDTALVRQVLAVAGLRKEFITAVAAAADKGPAGDIRFRTKRVEDYLRLVDEFRKILLITTHLLGGQPARTTEILPLRYMNTPYGGLRNVFIQHKMVCLLSLYHKGYQLQGQTKVVYRYLPHEVGEVFVQYLAIILPFAQQLQIAISCSSSSGTSNGNSNSNGHGTSNGNNNSSGSGAKISPFIWATTLVRHPTTTTTVITPVMKTMMTMPTTTRTDNDDGVGNLWSSDKMRRLLQQFTRQYIGSPLDISSWRHLAISIGRRYLHAHFGDGEMEASYGDSDTEDEDQLPDNIFDRQAGHSSYVANAMYGREIQQGATGLAVRQEQFRKASMMWHRFFGLGASDDGPRKPPRLGCYNAERYAVRQARLRHLQAVDLLGSLRQLVRDPAATFRGNQQAALEAVVRGHTPVLQISSTGVGKTMTFLLPSYVAGAASASTTVVVVPFIALQEDIRSRCRTMGIHCEVWSPYEAHNASIVLVTPESFVTKTFREFLNRLTVRHQLDRVVLDECHTILDASFRFRPDLRTIGTMLIQTGAQLVFLTATMPPRDEAEFWTTLGLNGSRAFVVRGVTTRPNLRYSVTFVDSSSEEEEEAARLIATVSARTTEGIGPGVPARVVVYCQSVVRSDQVAERLGCDSYHSQSGDTLARAAIVQNWVGKGGPIVATSAMGAGVDIPDVRLVVHIGKPRSLRDFVQESGRAGRDGQPAQSIVFLARARRTAGAAPTALRTAASGLEDITEWVMDEVACRRTMLSRVMDGRMDRLACEEGEELCDHCTARVADEEAAAAVTEGILPDEGFLVAQYAVRAGAGRVQEVARQLEEFVQGLERFRNHCLFCAVLNPGGSDDYHRFSGCPARAQAYGEEARTVVEEIQSERKELQRLVRQYGFSRYSGCFYCAAPQQFCGRWRPVEGDEGSFELEPGAPCSYEGVIFEVFSIASSLIMTDETVVAVRDIVRQLGVWVEEGIQIDQLIFINVRWEGVQTNGLCILFWYIVRQYL